MSVNVLNTNLFNFQNKTRINPTLSSIFLLWKQPLFIEFSDQKIVMETKEDKQTVPDLNDFPNEVGNWYGSFSKENSNYFSVRFWH